MLKLYLLVFVFILIAIQPSIVKMFNSSSLGRLMLISAIIFCTLQNQLAGLALTVLVIAVLNETGPENFDTYPNEEEEEDEEKQDERMSICETCPSFIKLTTQCKECGCIMKMKTKLEQAVCPLGKW